MQALFQTPGVMILNTDKKLKAVNLCDRLVELQIPHLFDVVGIQFVVVVKESDVKAALNA